MQKKIVLTGGPGTGKSSILDELKARGFSCMPEISREVTKKAQKKGIQQLFLSDPLLFSNLLFKGSINLNKHNKTMPTGFFDRIPDVYAYLDYSKASYPRILKEKSRNYRYDVIFLFKPWSVIYISDNERYENFEESKAIDRYLQHAYQEQGYSVIEVPFGTVKERCNFMINWLKTYTWKNQRCVNALLGTRLFSFARKPSGCDARKRHPCTTPNRWWEILCCKSQGCFLMEFVWWSLLFYPWWGSSGRFKKEESMQLHLKVH